MPPSPPTPKNVWIVSIPAVDPHLSPRRHPLPAAFLRPVESPLTHYTTRLSSSQADALESLLRNGSFELRTVPHARVAAAQPRLQITLYESLKLLVQGQRTQEFVEFTLEPTILQQARLGYEDTLDPQRLDPRIGIDESGKGDFFGPLCVAGVYVNARILDAWKSTGIRDSKSIGSDLQIARLAQVIRATPDAVHSVVAIGPEAYNRMHRANGSVNRILAWGHARVLENLLLQRHRMVPPPVRAISDQFASSTHTIQRALLTLGRDFQLVQRHRAEDDPAVAAASILARDEFVRRLQQLGSSFQTTFPKGAAPQVEAVGRDFVAQHGPQTLSQVAKMHFRTSFRILGLPEPPATPYQRPPRRPPSP